MREMQCSVEAPEKAAWAGDDVRFVDNFEKKVSKTITQYRLLSKNEKIIVAVSGGKDSTAILHILKKLSYPVEAVTVDAHIGCYTEENLKNLRATCKQLNVKLHEVPFRKVFGASLCYIRDYLKEKGHNFKSCTVCGVLRRYLLNKKAKELRADKLVLGHNLDDEAQSVLMNLLKNRPELNARLGPKVDSVKDRKFVPRVKPFYNIREDEIVRYSRLMEFPVKYTRCPCSVEGFRSAVRNFLTDFEQVQPGIKENVVKRFLAQREKLQKRYAKGKHAFCVQCGEFSSGNVCKACTLLGLLHKPLKS
jgi:uncharacterized protein (TIGR00269 family)